MWRVIQKLQSKKVKQKEEPAPKPAPKITDQDLIIIRIMAPKEKFYTGYELLQALLSNGFRFGDMNIFHHYEKGDNEGKILFSLARATEPGTFDIRDMGNCICQGLTIFMRFSEHKKPMHIFDKMFAAAQKLIDDLGGEIWAEGQKIDESIIEKWRTRIKNYENSLYTYDLFE